MVVLSAVASFEAVLPLPLVFSYLEESMSATRRLLKIIHQKTDMAEEPGAFSAPPDYSDEEFELLLSGQPVCCFSGGEFLLTPKGES